MKATIKSEKKHFPVLLDKLISIISPLYGGLFIDCTFGQGGYSEQILKNEKNSIIALDRDKSVFRDVEVLKQKYPIRFNFYNVKFSEIDKLDINPDNLKAIIFDLGYSFKQIKDKSRGISFHSKTNLNMKMGLNEFSADDVVNKLEFEDLSKIIKFFGDENKSKLISKKIIIKIKKKKLNTEDLVSIINQVKIKKKNVHPATKTFQALRIFVNKEISELINGLINSFKILPIGGVMVVITFHSIEDKIVKFFFKHYSENNRISRYVPKPEDRKILFKLLDKKATLPKISEIKLNPPSRSAKLRYAVKINNSDNFEDFFSKFQKLLSIEDLGNKLWIDYH